MATKKGAGGKQQEYNEENGQYGGNGGSGSSSDGFGGTHEATPAERERLRAYGVQETGRYGIDNGVKEYRQNTSYSEVLSKDKPISFGKEIDVKLKKNEPLTDDEAEEVFLRLSTVFEVPEKNKGDLNLKRVLDLNGFAETPRKVGANQLMRSISNGTVMFRGLNGEDASRYGEEFYNGEMFVGIGFGGNGVYMSKDLSEAKNYTKGSNTVVVAVMPNDMKIAGREVRREYEKFSERFKAREGQSKQEKEHVWAVSKVVSFGTYCALKGYDAYLPVIKPESNMVVLNRGKLIVGENNEQEGFLELY